MLVIIYDAWFFTGYVLAENFPWIIKKVKERENSPAIHISNFHCEYIKISTKQAQHSCSFASQSFTFHKISSVCSTCSWLCLSYIVFYFFLFKFHHHHHAYFSMGYFDCIKTKYPEANKLNLIKFILSILDLLIQIFQFSLL